MSDAAIIEPPVAPPVTPTATPPVAPPTPPTGNEPPVTPPPAGDTPPSDPATPPSDDPPSDGAAWRKEMAGEDEDLLKVANRYGSKAGVLKALAAAQALIRSGKVKGDSPDPADAKAVAAWRKAEGIPDDAAGYKTPEIKNFQWSDADKPLLAGFFEKAHAKGIPQATIDSTLSAYAELQQDMQARIAESDKAAGIALEDKLRQSWGSEYRGNWNLAQRFLQDTPLGLAWANATMPDGRMLGHIPEFAEWASDQGRQRYGDTAFIPGDVNSKGANRLEEIRTLRAKDYDAYSRDKKMQAEELDLIDRELKAKKASAR